MLDSMAFANMERQIKNAKPDVIEILPALMPKIIRKTCAMTSRPVVAGGLVSDKEDVMACLDAGATCISSTNTDVWFL
jgi:glycerol-3-phosphate responsive antiterminator